MDERAKAVGALCNMMATKTMSWRDEEDEGESPTDEAEVGRDEAPRETPSAMECASNPITVEIDDASALIRFESSPEGQGDRHLDDAEESPPDSSQRNSWSSCGLPPIRSGLESRENELPPPFARGSSSASRDGVGWKRGRLCRWW